MKIAINSLCAVAGGAVTHLQQLLPELAVLAEADEILLIGNATTRASLDPPPGIRFVDAGDVGQGILSRLWWDATTLPGLLRELGADVLFQPANLAAPRAPVPQVILIHNVAPFLDDVIAMESPYQRLRLRLLRRLTRASMRVARRTIFISEWGKARILTATGLPDVGPVISFGAEHLATEAGSGTLERFGLAADTFVLCVSHLYRYKRIERLIDAHGSLDTAMPLVVVGAPYDAGYAAELELDAERSPHRVLFTGALGGGEMAELMAACRAFAFPSEAENLPITLLEAMAMGCPIVTNRCCSMPEVCGDAAIYADPPTSQAYAAALGRVIGDSALREALAAAGRARVGAFRWSETAARTLSLLRAAGGTAG